MTIRCFLPCRKGSERVPQKNIKPFAGYDGGLLGIKLRQLLGTRLLEEVVLSTNDQEILEFADSLHDSRIVLHHRDEKLCTSQTSTDDLVRHAAELIPEGHILWTHVTSPFVGSGVYDSIIDKYFSVLGDECDSLMTTTLIHGFLWNDKGPVNYDRNQEKWPRTQTIPAMHEVNSAVFLSSAENYRKFDDRIGAMPFLFPLDKITSFDIDWPEDFALAECVVKAELARI